MAAQNERYNWLDVFKAFSIYFILFAHLNSSSRFATYVFSFMVHAFFFAAGVTASRNKDKSLKDYAVVRFKRLMIPYFIFGVIAMVVKLLVDSSEIGDLGNLASQLVYGYRLKHFAITLWFLPCLYMVGLYYQVLLRFIKSKWLRMAICVLASFVFRLFSEGNVLPWGIDNAVKYLIYYGAGDFFADMLNGFSKNPKLIFKKLWPTGLFIICAGFSYVLHQKGYTFFTDLVGIPSVYIVMVLLGCFYAFVGIYLFSIISIFLQDNKALQAVGKASLIICCMQLPIDRLVYNTAHVLGLSLSTETQGQCLIITIIFVWLGVKAHRYISEHFPVLMGMFPAKK